MVVDEPIEVLKVDTEAVRIRIISEPYVTYSAFGYQPAVDVFHLKKKRTMRLFVSAKTLGQQLEAIRVSNERESLSGIEVWIHKESNDRRSKYVLSER